MSIGFQYQPVRSSTEARTPIHAAMDGRRLGYVVTTKGGHQYIEDASGRRLYRVLRWKQHNSTVSACGGSWVP